MPSNNGHNRRSFLSSIAILTAGTVAGSAIKQISTGPIESPNNLKKNWEAFWKKSGGQAFYYYSDLQCNKKGTKGHHYKFGEIIYFPMENILAQPTWIFWENDRTHPADLVVTLFENNYSFNKIISFNRYEMDALYHLSNKTNASSLILTSFKNSKPGSESSTGIIKTSIIKKVQIQTISYYNGNLLVFQDTLIHHT